jgi:hypothetical protein
LHQSDPKYKPGNIYIDPTKTIWDVMGRHTRLKYTIIYDLLNTYLSFKKRIIKLYHAYFISLPIMLFLQFISLSFQFIVFIYNQHPQTSLFFSGFDKISIVRLVDSVRPYVLLLLSHIGSRSESRRCEQGRQQTTLAAPTASDKRPMWIEWTWREIECRIGEWE